MAKLYDILDETHKTLSRRYSDDEIKLMSKEEQKSKAAELEKMTPEDIIKSDKRRTIMEPEKFTDVKPKSADVPQSLWDKLAPEQQDASILRSEGVEPPAKLLSAPKTPSTTVMPMGEPGVIERMKNVTPPASPKEESKAVVPVGARKEEVKPTEPARPVKPYDVQVPYAPGKKPTPEDEQRKAAESKAASIDNAIPEVEDAVQAMRHVRVQTLTPEEEQSIRDKYMEQFAAVKPDANINKQRMDDLEAKKQTIIDQYEQTKRLMNFAEAFENIARAMMMWGAAASGAGKYAYNVNKVPTIDWDKRLDRELKEHSIRLGDAKDTLETERAEQRAAEKEYAGYEREARGEVRDALAMKQHVHERNVAEENALRTQQISEKRMEIRQSQHDEKAKAKEESDLNKAEARGTTVRQLDVAKLKDENAVKSTLDAAFTLITEADRSGNKAIVDKRMADARKLLESVGVRDIDDVLARNKSTMLGKWKVDKARAELEKTSSPAKIVKEAEQAIGIRAELNKLKAKKASGLTLTDEEEALWNAGLSLVDRWGAAVESGKVK